MHLERLYRKPAPPVAGSCHREVTQLVEWGAYISGMSFNTVAVTPSPLQTAKLLSIHSAINAFFPFIHPFIASLIQIFITSSNENIFLLLDALMDIVVIIL